MTNVIPLRSNDARWKAVLTYRTADGISARTHFFEEILELHDIIEKGPHWSCLVDCIVLLNRTSAGVAGLTIEEAYEL